MSEHEEMLKEIDRLHEEFKPLCMAVVEDSTSNYRQRGRGIRHCCKPIDKALWEEGEELCTEHIALRTKRLQEREQLDYEVCQFVYVGEVCCEPTFKEQRCKEHYVKTH